MKFTSDSGVTVSVGSDDDCKGHTPYGACPSRIPRNLTSFTVGVLLTLSVTAAVAHEVRPAVIDLYPADNGYRLDFRINLEAMMAEISPEHSDTDESVNAPRYNALRGMSSQRLAEEFDGYRDRFLGALAVKDGAGQRMRHRVVRIEIPEAGDLEQARDSIIVLEPERPPAGGEITWSWAEAFGPNVIRVNNADGSADEGAYSAYLGGGETSRAIPLGEAIRLSALEVAWNYLVIGFTHILPKGLDHILFVVGLFLLSPALRPLLIQVTSFTVAHTVTLALGTLGLVNISPAIVEPIIAASIVYVAVENIVSDRMQKWRPLIVFGFGLLHGLGFAGVLAEIGIASDFFVTALLSFNVGVEFGQLAVILLCLLLFGWWFKDRVWYRSRITIPLSLMIAAVGAYWVVERTLL